MMLIINTIIYCPLKHKNFGIKLFSQQSRQYSEKKNEDNYMIMIISMGKIIHGTENYT